MRWLKRSLLSVLLPLALLAGTELFLRVLDWGYPTGFLVGHADEHGPCLIDNQFFGYRFFPPRLARAPLPLKIRSGKPPDVLRVVVLGESAAMGEPAPAYGLARQLECLLAAALPQRRVEVINAAMTAVNSHAITEIASALTALQPDWFVVYMGNNEVVGPYGPGTVFRPLARPPYVRWRVCLTRLRLAQVLAQLAGGLGLTSEAVREWRGMALMADRLTPETDSRLASVYAGFSFNLEHILDRCRAAGAGVALCTVAVNLRDCAPFAAATNAAGESALDRFKRAVQLEAQGDVAGAREWYARARDGDALRFRADSEINRRIRAAAGPARPGVVLVDAEKQLQTTTGGAPGAEIFLDHVHLNFSGNYRLAQAVCEAILPRVNGDAPATAALLPAEAVAERLAYNARAELQVLEIMRERRHEFPFARQHDNARQLARLVARKLELIGRLQDEDWGALEQQYAQALAEHADDWVYPYEWGRILLDAGRYADAAAQLRRAVDLMPHRYDLRGAAALALGFLGEAAAGIALVDTGDRGRFFQYDALLACARGLLRAGFYHAALEYLDAADRVLPDSGDTALDRAACCARLGRVADAERILRARLSKRANGAAAGEELAMLLTMQGRFAEADEVFAALAREYPEQTAWRLKQAVALIYRDETGAAERELTALVAQQPDEADAHYYLAQIYLRADRLAEARIQLRETLRLAPDHARAYALLARLDRREGRVAEADRSMEIARRLGAGRSGME